MRLRKITTINNADRAAQVNITDFKGETGSNALEDGHDTDLDISAARDDLDLVVGDGYTSLDSDAEGNIGLDLSDKKSNAGLC